MRGGQNRESLKGKLASEMVSKSVSDRVSEREVLRVSSRGFERLSEVFRGFERF